jgi:Ca2+-binding EF-hand superfamily protein
MAVSLQSLQYAFARSDIDGNGKLDRPEIAKASLHYLGSKSKQEIGQFFATLVQGGKDKQGLFPDFNNDGSVDMDELKVLSRNKTNISSDDFKTAFGNRFQQGGQSVDLNALKSLAQQNLSKFQACAPGFSHAVNDYLLHGKGPANNGWDNPAIGGWGCGQPQQPTPQPCPQNPQGGQIISLMQNMLRLLSTLLTSLLGNQGGNAGSINNFSSQNAFSGVLGQSYF